jgi:hypothetical protein
MSIRIPLSSYYSNRTGITVELDDEQRLVEMGIESETDTEPPLDRYLSPAEARALAAMLVHYAENAERPR